MNEVSVVRRSRWVRSDGGGSDIPAAPAMTAVAKNRLKPGAM